MDARILKLPRRFDPCSCGSTDTWVFTDADGPTLICFQCVLADLEREAIRMGLERLVKDVRAN